MPQTFTICSLPAHDKLWITRCQTNKITWSLWSFLQRKPNWNPGWKKEKYRTSSAGGKYWSHVCGVTNFPLVYEQYQSESCKNFTPVLCVTKYFTIFKAITDIAIQKPNWRSDQGCPLRTNSLPTKLARFVSGKAHLHLWDLWSNEEGVVS
jgi:hypothetical protein